METCDATYVAANRVFTGELRVAKVRVGIFRVEVRAEHASRKSARRANMRVTY